MKHVARLAGLFMLTFAFGASAALLETRILSVTVSGIDEGGLEDWLKVFVQLSLAGLAAALFAALLWYALGQLVFRVQAHEESNRRPVWAFLAVFPALAALVGVLKLPAPEQGAWLAYALLVCCPMLCYYLSTVYCAPSPYRYTPFGAEFLRGLVGK
jgi:hypothetical protein